MAGSSWHKTCLSRPTGSAYHACLGLGRLSASDMHARTCPSASGLAACTCMHVPSLRLASTSAGMIGLDPGLDKCFVHGPPRLGFT
eukprot:366313-Chlamydomonas_euryale.AAC.13